MPPKWTPDVWEKLNELSRLQDLERITGDGPAARVKRRLLEKAGYMPHMPDLSSRQSAPRRGAPELVPSEVYDRRRQEATAHSTQAKAPARNRTPALVPSDVYAGRRAEACEAEESHAGEGIIDREIAMLGQPVWPWLLKQSPWPAMSRTVYRRSVRAGSGVRPN